MGQDDAFADVLAANAAYAREFRLAGLEARAAARLGVLTCIDSRIEPLAMLGLRPGDAKILRNAGARVTDDVLRTLVLASWLLDVERLMVIGHTRCRMTAPSDEVVRADIREAGGPDVRGPFLVAPDLETTLRADVEAVRSSPHLGRLETGGFVYDVDTGRLRRVC